MPKLSIIIPTFNSGAVLGRALDSIVGQTFIDWEVLIMDGVSTDNTLDVANSYNDNRIHVYSEPDNGIYDAMNKGIIKAKGEWFYFLGSDDWLLNSQVLQTVFQFDVKELDVMYGEVEAPQLGAKHRGVWSVEQIEYNICHQAILFRSNLFKRIGLYNNKYKILADFEFNLRWFLNGKINSKHIDLEIAHYTKGGVSECCIDEPFEKDYPLLLLKYGHKTIPIKRQKEIARQAMCCNGNKSMLVVLLKTYVYWLRMVDAIRRYV